MGAADSGERSVLHVLPHPGGGGETYVDTLESMEGFRLERVFLAPGPRPRDAIPALLTTVPRANLAGRRHDVIHVHGEAAGALSLPSLATRPSVVTLHGLNLVRRTKGAKHHAAVANLRLVLMAAARTICVTKVELEEIATAVGERLVRRVVVIPNGVQPTTALASEEHAAVRRELGLDESAPVAIWVGSLEPHKDPATAARAAAAASTTMLVVGDGPLRKEVELLGGPWVHVLGERRDVRRLLAAADVFVLTSQREGLSFSLLEAMAAGLPSIVTNHPANLEAMGDAGLDVAYADVPALAAAIKQLSQDAAERADLGERARCRVRDVFLAEKMVARTREIYEAVLSERQPRKRPLPTAQ